MTIYFMRKSCHNESTQRRPSGQLNGTGRTISFEELSGVSIVVAYSHLSWGRLKGNGVKVYYNCRPTEDYRKRVTNAFSHLVTPFWCTRYHPLHGTHTSTTLSASSAMPESTM